MQEPSIGYSLLDTFVYDVHLIDQTSAVFNITHTEAPLSVTGLSTLLDQTHVLENGQMKSPPIGYMVSSTCGSKKHDFQKNEVRSPPIGYRVSYAFREIHPRIKNRF